MFKSDDQLEQFLEKVKMDDAPNPSHRDALEQQVLEAYARRQLSEQKSVWRRIMKSRKRLTGTAAAILLFAIIAGFVYQFGFNSHLAFAQVVEKVIQSRTLTYKVTTLREGKTVHVQKTYIREPYMRGEDSDGSFMVADFEKGRAVVLEPKEKLASWGDISVEQRHLNIIDTFRNILNKPEYSYKEIGRRQIDGIDALGFEVHRMEDVKKDFVVWVNPATKLPVQIIYKSAYVDQVEFMYSDIVFDLDLDLSLFNMTVPEGYHGGDAAKRDQSANNMEKIVKACQKFAAEHENQWPDHLCVLNAYGIEKENLLNPQRPELQTGYIYLKPPTPVSPDRVVLYEAYETWGSGINVGFGNTHVKFIKEEAAFKKLLP